MSDVIATLNDLDSGFSDMLSESRHLDTLVTALAKELEGESSTNPYAFNLGQMLKGCSTNLTMSIHKSYKWFDDLMVEVVRLHDEEPTPEEPEEPTPEDCSPVERFSYEITHEPITGIFYTTFDHPITHESMFIRGESEQDVIKKADWLSDITPPDGIKVFF